MALTAAEKQKRYREKLKKDPQKYEEAKKKLRTHYHKNKRLIKDLSAKEKSNARVIWKLRKRQQRQRKRALENVINNTPPGSPALQKFDDAQILLQNQGFISPTVSVSSSKFSPSSSQAKRGRKAVRRDRTKLYIENQKLQNENEKLKLKYEKYKKRFYRIKNKTQEELKNKNSSEKKYKILTSAISQRYENVKKMSEKRLFKRIFMGSTVRESRVKKQLLKDSLNLVGTMRSSLKPNKAETDLQNKIKIFFERDDVSRNTAGKKKTVTKDKLKVQKRYLLDTIKNLYKTFKQENPDMTCSYFYFTKIRPWYVEIPSVDGREMCLCKIHSNMQYKAIALHSKQVLKTKDLSQIIMYTVCDPTNMDCMYGSCQNCKKKKMNYDETKIKGKVYFSEWIRKEDKYTKEGKHMKSVKNVKETKEVEIKDLKNDFEIELFLLKKHVYNMKTQYKNFRRCIDEMQLHEATIPVDFSENYNCKYNQEVQAHHFGGSRQQLSLHTVMVYLVDLDKKIIAESFCTVSSHNLHQPAAIWAHLHPILRNIQLRFPEVKTLHFFSDGPFTQYRQKQNFYLTCTKPFEYYFEAVTWSFFEAGHGKGPADGIGGFLKRTADGIVAKGKDISNIEQFVDALQETSKIVLFIITKEDIENISKELPTNIKRLQGTLHMHQVFTSKYGELMHRTLSCFCERGFCKCFEPKLYNPIPLASTTTADVSVNNNMMIPLSPTDSADASIARGDNIVNTRSSPMSSDDDVPLNKIKSRCFGAAETMTSKPLAEINYTDLAKDVGKRGSVYDMVYGSMEAFDQENQPTTSGNNKMLPSNGDFLLVKVHAGKNKTYTYASLAQSDLHDDGEIKVVFLRAYKGATKFKLDEKDIAFVEFDDILKILPKPKQIITNGKVYYNFQEQLDIFEK